jgi:hypothetical protein
MPPPKAAAVFIAISGGNPSSGPKLKTMAWEHDPLSAKYAMHHQSYS